MNEFDYTPKKMKPSVSFINGPDLINQRTVCDFWQWSFSDLLQNTTRGVLAEYIVAVLLVAEKKIRNPWLAFDLQLPDGRTIEVKTMSLLQAWAQKTLSKPRVILSPTRRWDPKTGEMAEKPTLNADLYIFCFFNGTNHDTANPLDLDQWEFFAFTKKGIMELLKGKKSISLKTLEKQGIKSVKAHELKKEVMQLK